MAANYKPIGGVERVLLYPTEAIDSVLFSSDGCEVEVSATPLEVELLDDASHYEEESDCTNGITRISHRLHLVADRREAEAWLATDFLERVAIEGVVARVTLCDGRTLLVGYSSHLGNEQPLHLECLISSSGSTLRDKPTVTLRLVSHDTEFASEII